MSRSRLIVALLSLALLGWIGWRLMTPPSSESIAAPDTLPTSTGAPESRGVPLADEVVLTDSRVDPIAPTPYRETEPAPAAAAQPRRRGRKLYVVTAPD